MGVNAVCAVCPAHQLRLCDGSVASNAARLQPKLTFDEAPAKSLLYRNGEYSNDVLLLCTGWAFRYTALPSGGRQILDLVLPGDLVPSASWYRKYFNSSVEALTRIRFARIDREELESYLKNSRIAMSKFIEKCGEETDRYERLLTDMGQRSATEAIARQILSIMNRLTRLEKVNDQAFDFPVRQQHIADLLGISQIHVNRVLGQLRPRGLHKHYRAAAANRESRAHDTACWRHTCKRLTVTPAHACPASSSQLAIYLGSNGPPATATFAASRRVSEPDPWLNSPNSSMLQRSTSLLM